MQFSHCIAQVLQKWRDLANCSPMVTVNGVSVINVDDGTDNNVTYNTEVYISIMILSSVYQPIHLSICLSVCLSVTLCIVAKHYILQHKYLNKWIGSAPLGTQFYNFQPPTLTLPCPIKLPTCSTKFWNFTYLFNLALFIMWPLCMFMWKLFGLVMGGHCYQVIGNWFQLPNIPLPSPLSRNFWKLNCSLLHTTRSNISSAPRRLWFKLFDMWRHL